MFNWKIIARFIGLLLLLSGAMMLLALLFSLKDNKSVLVGIVVSSGITLSAGALLYLLGLRASSAIKKRDGYLIVTLGWVAMTLFGALPYFFTGAIPSVTNSVFESVSGFTTTGASILSDIEIMPKSILFWRSITQWLSLIHI